MIVPRIVPRALVGLIAAALLLAGCDDLRQFAGTWSGEISGDPAHQEGFGAKTKLDVTITSVAHSTIDMTVTLPGRGALRFEPIRHAADDVLADAQLAGSPLRTYFGFVTPIGEAPFLTVVSLYAESRIEIRLIRGPDDAYGVFSLSRVGAP